MDVQVPLQMLGGLSPKRFMRQYWQKKPLLVRQAFAGFRPLLDPRALFALAARDEVQSRLVVQTPGKGSGWELRHGPFQRLSLIHI